MAGEKTPKNNETTAERASRFLRNLNAVGAVALFGVGLAVPAGAVALNTWAAINTAQAGGFEAARRHFKKKRIKKLLSKS
ncbi:MAG TPA: hypothetical protein VFK11_00030 [Candidatus Saccharimonadales bacterium]|nr:hypothetical protein [Candidatus Saccharimonadales bacterium]